ncbi:receptor expression-enhancing protein 2 isoform X3 [Aquila chrysaetos chrysaetos]|uniref:receptor expression-enhancing protein 2 isoform X3 n=1 Tax=Aquila chrysaetos chrysaetos TaxID=223781 RepID=UPI001177203D|nr:receptor expression-enhancing protein 2 isoform X3 [Aquila chrysaetos chrysaetos]
MEASVDNVSYRLWLLHLTAVVANSLEEATSRKMAASAPSLTPSSEVPVLSTQHLLFCHVLGLRMLLRSKSPFPSLPGAHRSPRALAGAPPRCGLWRDPPRCRRRRRALALCGAGGANRRGLRSGAGRDARARCGPLPPTRRLLPFKHPGRGCACCRNLPFKSRLPPPPLTPRPPPEPARRRHGLLDHLPPRGADLRHPLPRVLLLQGREDEKREGICEVDDVLDCVRLLHHCRNSHRHCSFLEIDEYITQARDKSYETMMRVGKRGLNLAANAAVTAAAKGQGVLSEKLRSFSMQDLTLIRDEDTVHMRSQEPQLHPSGGSLLETIEDSASCYSSGEESSVAQRSNGTPSETRTDPSDEDAGDKLPKRTQSLKTPKKMMKAEVSCFQ